MSDESLQAQINELRYLVDHAYRVEMGDAVFLTAPLTSTSWDGDARSTTAKTLIDLSAVFGVPAEVRAVLVRLYSRDSGSSGTTACWLGIAPNNTAGELAVVSRPGGLPNDYYHESGGWCPCNASGDIYFQCAASGAATLDVWLEVWGYMV